MVSIIKKKIKGHIYYYAVKSARVNGKPRTVWQQYLGTAEDIAKRLTELPKSKDISVKTMPFGHVAALMRVDEELGFVDIVDRNTYKKRTSGLSVGQYLLIHLMGRAEGALSRSAIAEWYPKSVVNMLLKTNHKMNAKNLLKHLDYPTTEAIRSIEDELASRLLELGLVPDKLLWDTTNFFTQIENGGDIPKKGHSKDKRNDKNLVGVGLAVSSDNVPFFHETFEANRHDSKVFSDVLDVIVARLKKLNIDAKKVVMILDKGNNSEGNIGAALERTHIIGTLKRSQSKEYLEVPLSGYKHLNKDDKGKDALKAYRTTGAHFNEEFTIVVTHNPRTQRKQKRRYGEKKRKALKDLAELKKKVENRKRRGRKWTQARAITAIADAIPKDMRSVFEYDVKKKVGRGGGLIVEYEVDEEKERQRYLSFGKIIHFTDLHDWSDEEISTSYNSKYQVEDDFKWLKDKLMVPVKPVHVWTDQHIRGHVFVCVMGLLFYRYIQWRLRSSGLKWSTQKLASVLDGIRLALILKDKRKKKGSIVVERMDKDEARIFSELDLAEYVKA